MINRVSCQGRRRQAPQGADVANYPAWEGVLERDGDFVWVGNAAGDITDLVIRLPGNEGGSIAPIPVLLGPHNPGTGKWGWNGDTERPTLTPSIWRNKASEERPDPRNEWHGNLIQGFLHSD